MQSLFKVYNEQKKDQKKTEFFTKTKVFLSPLFNWKKGVILTVKEVQDKIESLYPKGTPEFTFATYLMSALIRWFIYSYHNMEDVNPKLTIHSNFFIDLSRLTGIKDKAYKPVIDSLVKLELIEIDYSYSNFSSEKWSMGYGCSSSLGSIIMFPSEMISISDEDLYKPRRTKTLIERIYSQYSYDIYHREDNMITMYRNNISRYGFDMEKLIELHKELVKTSEKKVLSLTHYQYIMDAVFSNPDPVVTLGDKGGRLYTSIHSMKRELRNAIVLLNGEDIYNADITNSQLCILLGVSKEFGVKIPTNIKNMILDGTIYEELGSELNFEGVKLSKESIHSKTGNARDLVKSAFYAMAFGTDKISSTELFKLSDKNELWLDVFAKFPEYRRWMKDITDVCLRQNISLAAVLQGLETDIVANIALPLELMTIHDCAFGERDRVELFMGRLKDEFARRYGFEIKIKMEKGAN